MTQTLALRTREEIANITLHSFGLFFSLIGFGVLIGLATQQGSYLNLIAASVYGATLISVYLGSVLFHSSQALELSWQKAFEVVDHCAIYLLIAGTYTPFLMVKLPTPLGWSMLAIIWVLAGLGILYKIFFYYASDVLSTLAYIAMGWLCMAFIKPLHAEIGWWGIGALVVGGLFYTIGAMFYIFDDRFRFAHAVWHICVMLGSLSHYFAIVYFVIQT